MALGLYWDEVPRMFGNPEQTLVFDRGYLTQLIKQNNGKYPCFITHNSFRVSKFGFPSEIHLSKIFLDMDSERKPENSLLDARRLCRFANELKHPIAFAYSAGKGFHSYPLFEPEYYNVGSSLKDAIRAVQLFFIGLGQEDKDNQEYEMKLRTADPKILGDERRLCRVWMTKYVSGRKKENGEFKKLPNYCCPLTSDMILNWSMKQIREYSLNPGKVKYDWSEFKPITLREFIKKYNIKKPSSYILKPESGNDGKITEFKGVAGDFILRLFPDRPCIAEAICQENPSHEARFAAVTYLRERLEMSQEQIFNLFQSRNWIDSEHTGVCRYQIDQIYRRGYKLMNCPKLRMKGLCIGFDKCEDIKSKMIPGYIKSNVTEWK